MGGNRPGGAAETSRRDAHYNPRPSPAARIAPVMAPATAPASDAPLPLGSGGSVS